MSTHPVHRTAGEQVDRDARHVEVAEGLPDLAARVSDHALARSVVELAAKPDEVELAPPVLGDRAAHDAANLRLDHRAVGVDDRGVAPVRVNGVVATKPALLRKADQAGEKVVPVRKDEVAR